MHPTVRNFTLGVVVSAFLAGCSSDAPAPRSAGSIVAPTHTIQSAAVVPSPPPAGDFVSGIDSPYLEFLPGTTFRYESHTANGVETTVTEVTKKTKRILGVVTTVVHDRVYLNGSLTEDTFDWYAQDRAGNVWYFGEESKEIQNGVVVTTEGSWEAGVNGAQPGIVMLADPKVGVQYRQEFAAGVAEDMAKVLSLKASVQVPYGSFDGCLQTMEWSPLEPGPREGKYYAAGTGLVLETGRNGERVELISIER